MDRGSPQKIKELSHRRMKGLQVRTHKGHRREGVYLASEEEEGLNRGNRANPLPPKEADQLPPLVLPPLLFQSSWVAFAPGTLLTLGERGGRKKLTRHTCGTFPSPLMSLLRRLTLSLLWSQDTWNKTDADGTL